MNHSDHLDLQFMASPTGRGYRLTAAQFLPLPREQVFEFFADAFQLEAITPPWLKFEVITPPPIALRAGALIDYRLRLRGLPLRWQSCISVWDPPHRFVDEQIRGPYRLWRHEHTFEDTAGGTLCRDQVDYEVPGGRLIEAILVRPDLRRVFRYRQGRLAELLLRPGAIPQSTHSLADRTGF